MLSLWGATQLLEEDGLFETVKQYTERASIEKGCIRFSEALEEAFRDVSEMREYVQTQEKELSDMKEKLHSLQSPDQPNATNSKREVQRGAAKVRDLTEKAERLDRAVLPNRRYRDHILCRLYALARETLLKQGLMTPESGEWRTRGASAQPAPTTGYNDDPGVPPLDPKDVQRYDRLRKVLVSLREDHDKLREKYAEELDKHLKGEPGSTVLEFDMKWAQKVFDAGANLDYIEVTFMEVRDKVLRAGAEPLAQGAEAYDIDQFTGKHPEDGKVGCMSAETTRFLEEKAVKDTPWIDDWRQSIPDGAAPSEHSVDDEQDDERAPGQEGAAEPRPRELVPWDSASQRERRPRARIRLSYHQRRYGHSHEL